MQTRWYIWNFEMFMFSVPQIKETFSQFRVTLIITDKVVALNGGHHSKNVVAKLSNLHNGKWLEFVLYQDKY